MTSKQSLTSDERVRIWQLIADSVEFRLTVVAQIHDEITTACCEVDIRNGYGLPRSLLNVHRTHHSDGSSVYLGGGAWRR